MLTSSESPETSSPSVTITLDELARAIDNMGLTPTVSAELLDQAILQIHAPPNHDAPQPLNPITPAQCNPNNDESAPIFINVIFRGRAF